MEPNGTPLGGQDQATGTGQGPWADDLAANFTDEAERQRVDAFLREKVQPYVTNVESQARPALELYQDLQANPGATYLELTTDLFGDEAAKAITGYLESEFGEGSNEPAQTPPANAAAQPPAQGAVDDPRINEMLSDWEEQRNERLYQQELTRLQTAHPDVTIKDNLFRPFVVAEDGDMDQAYAKYEFFVQTARAELFGDTETAAPQAPPTLGTGNAGGTTAPATEPKYESLGDAIEDWAAEQKALGQSVAPPVPGR